MGVNPPPNPSEEGSRDATLSRNATPSEMRLMKQYFGCMSRLHLIGAVLILPYACAAGAGYEQLSIP
jgi:hypothetical protein